MTAAFSNRLPRLIALAAALLFLAAGGCGRADTDSPGPTTTDAGTSDCGHDAGTPIEELTQEGDWEVGYMENDIQYRAEADGKEGPRTLNLSIWYPERENSRGEGAARYAGLYTREVVTEEPPVASLRDMPLLVFSHGNGGIAEQNYFQTEFFASHGWVAVAPDHTGNTFKTGTALELEAAVYRPQDIVAVLDYMTDLPDDHRLAGRLSDDVALSGHSFGGFTALANSGATFAIDVLERKCENGQLQQSYCDVYNRPDRRELFRKGFYDDRIDIGIPEAPAGATVFREGLADIRVPTLLVTAGMDQTVPNAVQGGPIWRMMKGEAHRRLHFPRGGHFTFSNMCSLFGGVQRIEQDGCSDRFVAPSRAHTILNAYALAFARAHFDDDPTARAVIDGKRSIPGSDLFEYSVGTD